MNKQAAGTIGKPRLFLALSRTERGILELANPALAALLWLGRFPDWKIIALGLATAFAGYTAVYALNDLIGYPTDREKFRRGGFKDTAIRVEGRFVRHPIAQGVLSFKSGLAWAVGWAVLALIGGWMLNPICSIVFLVGAALEAAYCLLFKVSHFRALIHGAVKTAGALAGVFAVSDSPSGWFLLAVFFWLYFWEIGGQNIPADWNDLEEDRMLSANTMILVYGPAVAVKLVLFFLAISISLSLVMFFSAPTPPGWFFFAALVGAGIYYLLLPALMLSRSPNRNGAGQLFSKATYYPPVVCLIVVLHVLTLG